MGVRAYAYVSELWNLVATIIFILLQATGDALFFRTPKKRTRWGLNESQ